MSASMLFPAATGADENVITYELFFERDDVSAAPDDGGDSDATDLRVVTHIREQMLARAAAFARDFVWQRQRFHLAAPAHFTSGDALSSHRLRCYHLRGETRVGDEIRDEWMVTALLVEFSRTFPSVLVRVRDADGEFLLIECADALPEWAHPENCGGRVLLRAGKLHLVPPSVVPEHSGSDAAAQRRRQQRKKHNGGEDLESETALRCLHAVLENPKQTRASGAMERALSSKLNDVPIFMQENRHRVRCLLPASAAQVLAQRPEVLGEAVAAFYYREPRFAAAICVRMNKFAPTVTPPLERMVVFSRCMFAQLKQQQFFAPNAFHATREYREALATAESETRDPVALAAEIGMKLTCGLELLYAAGGDDQFGESWRRIIDEALAQTPVPPQDAELGENDDDSWLYMHPDSLEEKLRQVEASMGMSRTGMTGSGDDGTEGGAEELESIATMFNSFLGGISGIDGVEGNEPIQFDMSAFMEILHGDGSDPQREPRFSDGGEYFYEDDDDDFGGGGSSDGDGDDDDDDDSDDNVDAQMEAAMAEMDAELSTSHMAKSFARLDIGADAATTDKNDDGDDDELDDEIAADKPLDLDFNLLSNLLESFASQDGNAGPVSNILGELNFPRAV